MPRSNIKLLTKDERQYLNENYIFVVKDDLLLVKVKDFARTTSHDINHNFFIKSKVRKLTIITDAMKMWIKYFIDSKWTLIDVQNAVNSLIISYQEINFENVECRLRHIEEKENTLI